MHSHRLVTLYGPGGSGKTRLALEVAKQEIKQYPDGVYFIDLSPVESPDLVATTFAQVLKINQEQDLTLEDSIVRNIAQKNILLLVDNC